MTLKIILAPELMYKLVALAWRQRPSFGMLGLPQPRPYRDRL
jgi:hypothetical protein